MRPQQLSESQFWLQGPAFLRQDRSAWPTPPAIIPTSAVLAELRKEEKLFSSHVVLPPFWPFQRFSTWNKHLRVLKRILAWLPRLARVDPARLHKQAELTALRLLQRHLLPASLNKLPGNFLDVDGIRRLKGRLHLASILPYEARNPALLPNQHSATILLVRHTHAIVAKHTGGVAYTLSLLLQKFWCPKIRALVTKVVNSCVTCRRYFAKPKPLPVAPLPDFRLPDLNPQPLAFKVTGIDCAGPLRVKIIRSYKQQY